jgi:hypothetical protein
MANQPLERPGYRPARHRAPVVQQCERCRLVLRHRAPWMQMTFCPRCIHAGHVVRLAPVPNENDNYRGPG